MPFPLVWITGAGGLIGSALVRAAPPHRAARGLTRAALELTDSQAVRGLFQLEQPQIIIHCAAQSRSPLCQADPPLARLLNVEVTARLHDLAEAIPFLFFSTDLVFDGRHGNYEETDLVNPLSVYAETKAKAEQVVLANPRHAVLRTSLNGGSSPAGDRAFNEEMRLAWRQGRTLTLFTDEFRCPIPASVTAQAVWAFLDNYQGGLYHLAGTQRMSRWEIGEQIASRWPKLNPKIQKGVLGDYHGAPRPPDTSLNCEKIQKRLPFTLPGLTEWLSAHPNEPF